MRLKDYLRGLGMGMIVVVLILTIGGRDRTMTDEEIMARARQLGMVDGNKTLTEIQEKESTSGEESSDKVDTTEPYEGSSSWEPTEGTLETEDSADSTENVQAEESSESTEDSETEESSASAEAAETEESTIVTIIVQRGDSSVSVSKDLAAAGAVENAKDFDRYLCEHGYDKRISVGTFEIRLGATHEEIAKIITKSK